MITYCLNMVISGGEKTSLQNLMTLGILGYKLLNNNFLRGV